MAKTSQRNSIVQVDDESVHAVENTNKVALSSAALLAGTILDTLQPVCDAWEGNSKDDRTVAIYLSNTIQKLTEIITMGKSYPSMNTNTNNSIKVPSLNDHCKETATLLAEMEVKHNSDKDKMINDPHYKQVLYYGNINMRKLIAFQTMLDAYKLVYRGYVGKDWEPYVAGQNKNMKKSSGNESQMADQLKAFFTQSIPNQASA